MKLIPRRVVQTFEIRVISRASDGSLMTANIPIRTQNRTTYWEWLGRQWHYRSVDRDLNA